MSCLTILHRSVASLLCTCAAVGLADCARDIPSEPEQGERPDAAGAQSRALFGPFPAGTTIFVDGSNTTGVEDGSRTHPFHTLRRGLATAKSHAVVGVAAGVYAGEFGTAPAPNYVIDGLKDVQLLGMGAKQTIIRGNHSFSLIRVMHGSSALIRGFTIEDGGDLLHSVGGGVQVAGGGDGMHIELALVNVILRNNFAVSGGAVAVDGDVTLRLVNVVATGNVGSLGAGAVDLRGTRGGVRANFLNTTMLQNNCPPGVGAVQLTSDARLDATNSVLWSNAPTEVTTTPGGQTILFRYSDVAGRLYPGAGNLSVDPLFVDPGSGNFRLSHTSPLIDAGTSSPAPGTDVLGKGRPIDGDLDCVSGTDIGAHEFNPGGSC